MPPFSTVFVFSLLILLSRVTKSDQTEKVERAILPFNDVIAAKESEALLSFYNKVPHTKALNWNKLESPCSWKGVSCDPSNTTVIQLLLPGVGLSGEIPPNTIGNLSNLLVLSLRHNGLSGYIPLDFQDLFLSELFLDDNRFTGGLENINADDLEKFNVSVNAFECFVPSKLSKFLNTSFLENKNLCVGTLSECRNNMSSTCRELSYKLEPVPIKSKKTLTVGIFVGLGLPLLVIFCCLRKKICQKSKQPPNPSLEAHHTAVSKKCGDGNDSFDCDELLRSSVEVLGKGSVGTSYKRVLEEKTVVLKRLEDVDVSETEFKSQMEVLRKMRNENLVPLLDYYCCSNDEKWLVYDYIPAGSLSAHLHGSTVFSRTRLDWDHRMRIALGAAKGVAYLHLGNVIHGNIKSSNVFLQGTKDATVSDYGLHTLSGWWSSPNHWMITGYWAPEVLKTRSFSLKSDVYSFGVLLLELLTGENPNHASAGEVHIDFPMWVLSVVHEEPKVDSFDVELRRDPHVEEMFHMLRIAKDCVSIAPDQRPQMQEVVSMIEEINRVQTEDWLRQSEGDDDIHLD
ncbi:hypothetical protein M8C21_015739 [Ambrosia artemisiifolia]|uniref:Protein kinase domain-containing protein n=1 Tax=Ambrosia artemisiifolia TaxID=4212 RepID=A0AAD5CG38_AMBAR|nr:hypothetical protein M8C21_015739 [Ambrosia artemisiifolia]